MSAPATVTVRIPGSTSNCGSGFDTLGLALRLYNRLTLTRRPKGPTPVPVGAAAGRARAMVGAAADAFFRQTGGPPFGFNFRVGGDVPPGCGLGSSATVRAGVVAGLNALAGAGLSSRQLVGLVTSLEGHPDNAAPSVLGGFCVARTSPATGAYLDGVRLVVPPEVVFVVVAPEGEVLTRESRRALPRTLAFADAVKSVNAATFLVAVFATRDFAKLSQAVADFIHEPYRLPGIPGARRAIDAGMAAGAFTGWLNGSGPSVLCVTEAAQAPVVRRAMETAFREAGAGCRGAWTLAADNQGLVVG